MLRSNKKRTVEFVEFVEKECPYCSEIKPLASSLCVYLFYVLCVINLGYAAFMYSGIQINMVHGGHLRLWLIGR